MSDRLSDHEIEAYFSVGTEHERRLAEEILERRAQDLSAEEVESLRVLRERAEPNTPWGNPQGYEMHLHNRILAILDRLLSQRGRR